jgi:hypothetical protein
MFIGNTGVGTETLNKVVYCMIGQPSRFELLSSPGGELQLASKTPVRKLLSAAN